MWAVTAQLQRIQLPVACGYRRQGVCGPSRLVCLKLISWGGEEECNVAGESPTGSVARWKAYRLRDWPRQLREYASDTPAGRQRWAEFEEYKAMAADRQARALLAVTWVLAAATVGLLVATAVLAYITATHTGH
jgi:hypothetical protein